MLPQIIILFLYAVALGIALAQDGKPKTGTESFWSTFIAAVLMLALLYWGGFFNVFFK